MNAVDARKYATNARDAADANDATARMQWRIHWATSLFDLDFRWDFRCV